MEFLCPLRRETIIEPEGQDTYEIYKEYFLPCIKEDCAWYRKYEKHDGSAGGTCAINFLFSLERLSDFKYAEKYL